METGLSLGSNVGDRLANLSEAKKRIGALKDVRIAACSPVYETSPVGVRPEFADALFLNAVLIVETGLPPGVLLSLFKQIEDDMGRTRSSDRNAPRRIDIDIVFAGDLCMDGNSLSVPHPRWASRRFVVKPLSDVRPLLRLPGQNETVRDLLSTLPDDQKVDVFSERW